MCNFLGRLHTAVTVDGPYLNISELLNLSQATPLRLRGHAPPAPWSRPALADSRGSKPVHGRPRSLLWVSSLLSSAFQARCGCTSTGQDVSIHVPSVLHGAGCGLSLHQGVLLGAVGDQGLRRDQLLADASGRRGTHPASVWQRREPVSGGAPAPALGKRPPVDGTVLHRGAGATWRGRRGAGEGWEPATCWLG